MITSLIVHKYEVNPHGDTELELCASSEVISSEFIDGRLYVWVLKYLPELASTTKTTVRVVFTGEDFPFCSCFLLNTLIHHNLVYHVFLVYNEVNSNDHI